MRIKAEERLGKVFGNLTAISIVSVSKHSKVLCKCSCGNECVVFVGSLVSGHTRSCGCLQRRIEDLSGSVFGRLVVREFAYIKNNISYWTCVCSCGTVKPVCRSALVSGATVSCGCFSKELAKAHIVSLNTTHGMGNTPEHRSWCSMLCRCFNTKDKSWPRYGGRGITVCEEWLKFENFYADMGDRPEGMSLDRVDNDGPYCKENCRWSTIDQQNNNRTNYCRFLMYRGEVRTASQWARAMGICLGTFWNRLKRGWSIEDALETPPGVKRGPRI